MSQAAIYVRVSSLKQAEEGLSLPEQEKRCREFVKARGWTLADVFSERGVSGAKAKRPQLDRLMAAIEEGGIDAVVTPKIDRLGRNARHNLELFEHFDAAGAVLYSPDGRDHTDKFIRTIESAVAERERESISERVKAITPAKRARGSYNGGPRPYGYEFVKDEGLVPVEAEAAVIRRIFSEYNAGNPLRAIARALNEAGVPGARGGAWTQARVADRLDNDLYAGRVGGGEQGRHESIIGPELWASTRDLRQATAQRAGKGTDGRTKAGRSSTALLLGNGLLRCSCGASFYPRRDSATKRGSYRCRGRDERATNCDVPALPGLKIDAAVRSYIANHVFSPGMAASDLEAVAKASSGVAAKQAAAAEREASELQAKVGRGRDMMLSEDPPFTATEWRDHRAKVEAQITAAKKRASNARALADDLREPASGLLSAVEALRKAAATEPKDAAVLARQRNAISRIIERFEVAVFPAAPSGRKLTDAERQLVDQQTAATANIIEPELEFQYKPRGHDPVTVSLVPIPRGEVPLAGLTDLSVRDGLALRTFGSIALTLNRPRARRQSVL